MVNYEGVFILDPDISAETTKTVMTQVQDMVTKLNGRIDGVQDWGKKRLAYRIRKKQDGYYFLLNFQLDSQAASKLDSLLRVNDNVMRFLIVNKDNL